MKRLGNACDEGVEQLLVQLRIYETEYDMILPSNPAQLSDFQTTVLLLSNTIWCAVAQHDTVFSCQRSPRVSEVNSSKVSLCRYTTAYPSTAFLKGNTTIRCSSPVCLKVAT